MNKLLLAAGLLAAMASGSIRTSADVIVVNIDQVPGLRPQRVVASTVSGELPQEVKLRLRFGQPYAGFSTGFYDRHPNETYHRAYLYPQMKYVLTHPPAYDLEAPRLGVERVEGYHLVWPEGATGGGKEHSEVDWQWQVPEELKLSWANWSILSMPDRYAALSLTPFRWMERNPTLCYFDAMMGLKWTMEVPVNATAQEARTKLPAPRRLTTTNYWAAHDVTVHVTQDGSRILILCPCPDLNAALLFIYDNSGNLRRSLVFPGCGTEGSINIGRAQSGKTFNVYTNHDVAERSGRPRHSQIDVCLMDAEGNLLCRYLDTDGKPSYRLPEVSGDDANASIQKDGKHYLYALPPIPNAKPVPSERDKP